MVDKLIFPSKENAIQQKINEIIDENTTDLATKVSKSGDTMTGDLEINKSIYLTSVAATAANSASKLYFGSKSSPYNYMAANTSGVFGIYNSSGKGIGCYPTQNLFPTNNIDLGRSNNKWKDIYASGKLYGASTNISITNLISGATLGATAIQPNDNISTLTNDIGYITDSALTDYITTTTLETTLTDYVTNSTLTTTLTDYVETTTLATVATSGSYDDLSDKPTIPTVPTNISAFTNDSGYITNSALSGYATENYVDTGLSAKQDTLVSGTNIKTVNNTSLLGSGNIDTSEIFIAEYGTTTFTEVLDAYNTGKIIFCYDDNDNIYAPITNYTVTDFYFSTGLINNISASYTLSDNDSWDGGTTTLATVATSGSYNDLSNKPTIPAAQVQANWNETDTNSMAYIQNKPNIPSGVVVDQTYDGTSANAQSGVAMAGELANYTKTANLPLTPYYATSTTAADTATKVVSIPAITTLNVGQIICVKPTITSTVATSKIKLNDFTAYNMRYNGANITTSTDSVVWNENWVSWFVFDGTYWQFAGHGYDNNTNTTYSAMSVSEGTTGTATNSRTVRADYLKQIIQGTKLTGLSTADNSAVVATDSILTGIGKLQAQLNGTVQIDDTTASQTSVYSSDKVEALISALTARIMALEANINGGNA